MIETWGSRAEERSEPFPCDELVSHPDITLYRAVSVEASPATVFRWLCQMRVAPYSYDLIDNLGKRSPQTLTPGTDHLEVGQQMMTIFRLASFTPNEQLTLTHRSRLFGNLAVTYRVRADGKNGSRLVAKLVTRTNGGVAGWLERLTLPAGDLVMMRRQLLNFARLAEKTPREAR